MADNLIVVAGGGGFIGGHLVHDLLRKGHRVRVVDVKPFAEPACEAACAGAQTVYRSPPTCAEHHGAAAGALHTLGEYLAPGIHSRCRAAAILSLDPWPLVAVK